MMDIWEAEPRLASQEPRPAVRMIGANTVTRDEARGCNPAVTRLMHARKGASGSAVNPFRVTHLRWETIAIR